MRLHERTTALRAAGRKALVPYLSAGYPDRAAFRRLLRATADAGCDVVEVGVPFSDPVADGPVIQVVGEVQRPWALAANRADAAARLGLMGGGW